MATIAGLAAELHAQPHEVAAFADLGSYPQDAELSAETEAMIREAWAMDPSVGELSTEEQNRAEDHVMDEVAHIVDRAGYDY